MTPRRVLLVNDYAGTGGGAELLMHDLLMSLRSRGVDARLLTSDVTEPRAGDAPADGALAAPFRGSTGAFRAVREVVNPSMMAAVRRELRHFRPDVVHLGMIFTQVSPWVLPLVAHRPVVWLPHTHRPTCPKGTRTLPGGEPCPHPAGRACLTAGCFRVKGLLPRLLQLRLARRWRGAIDHAVAPSQAFADALSAHGWRVDSVIHHGTRVGGEPAPLDDTPLVVYAGRLAPEKGVDTLLEAFGLVLGERPDARLLVAGEGPERARLEAMVRAGDNGLAQAVTFTGHLSRDALRQRFAGAWVQVVPSRWAEPFGLVTIEALARGTVVLASRVGALPELVADGRTGCLVPPNDARSLADRLCGLLASRERLEPMRRTAALEARERFGLEAMTTRYVQLYEQLAVRRGAAP